MDVNLRDCLKLGFSGFNIKFPYLVADLDFVNAPMSVLLYHNSITKVNNMPPKTLSESRARENEIINMTMMA